MLVIGADVVAVETCVSVMFVAVPDQVEETVTSLINLNNDFVSEFSPAFTV